MGFNIYTESNALKRLADKTVIITGGASGIGLEAAELFHSLGSNVVLADINAPPAQLQLLTSQRALFVHVDITSWTSLLALFDAAVSKFGQIDVVCANAGINEIGDQFFGLQSDTNGKVLEPDQKTIDVNLKGTALTIALAIHHMSVSGGSIILTSSLAGYTGIESMPNYAASKTAMVSLMRSLQNPAASRNIAISVVAPGMTPTPILADLPGVPLERDENNVINYAKLYKTILSRGIESNKTETVALAIVYLANGGMEVTGQGLLVQGDAIYEVEKAISESRPEWFVDKVESTRNSASAIMPT